MAVFDLFFAGTDTSQMTFRWLLLHMTYNKEFEKKLREEIESVIGDRMPTHEDRNRCHYCMAFISETLMFSNIVPSGVQHVAIVDNKIGNSKKCIMLHLKYFLTRKLSDTERNRGSGFSRWYIA